MPLLHRPLGLLLTVLAGCASQDDGGPADTGCAEGHPEGGVCISDFHYLLTVGKVTNSCAADGGVEHPATLAYTLRFAQQHVAVARDDLPFAAGTAAGCQVDYEASLSAGDLPFVSASGESWELVGSAAVDVVGAGDPCVYGTTEWASTESYTSDEGCVYTVTSSGELVGVD
ncbi:MAG: hypothetical protein V4850_28950 [Myxococcota bacterium]